ncbi:hypothetical protein QBC44DRAFT_332649 [Cladorrhinum sp. PSN332]|nr:hypothetical protein QBC44DRAFT_332649 [Cladorrhinum sp. PSN332]
MLETVWTKLESQLGLIRKMNGHLSNDLAQNHSNLLDKLESVLGVSVGQLERATSSRDRAGSGRGGVLKLLPLGRWKYALMRKSLDVLIKELEEWQDRFDPSWYLIQLISSEVLNPALVSSSRRVKPATTSSSSGPLDDMIALRQAIQDEQGSRRRSNLYQSAEHLARKL